MDERTGTGFQQDGRAGVGAASPADASPLTEAHYRLLRQYAAGRRPIRSAAATARASAVTILVVGGLALPVALVSLVLSATGAQERDWLGLVTAVGVVAIGYCELLGARQMRRAEPGAAGFLARNQLLFLGLIFGYCIIHMLRFGRSVLATALGGPQVQTALDESSELQPIGALVPMLAYGFYGLVMFLSLCFQGGLALYYFTRRRHLRAVQQTTPGWIQRVFSELDV